MYLTKELLKSGLTLRIKAKGFSMLPFIRTGNYLTVKPVPWRELRTGDIIAYSRQGQEAITCHRLVRIEDAQLMAKGDSQWGGYERVPFEALLGRVIYLERGRNRICLDTKFQRRLASRILWLSLRLPILLLGLGYIIEVVRKPHLAPLKFIRKIRRDMVYYQYRLLKPLWLLDKRINKVRLKRYMLPGKIETGERRL